jgi:hypothetical protein
MSVVELLVRGADLSGSFSPDGRFLAFLSNEADGEKMDVYVRPFDAAKPQAPAGSGVRVSNTGALGSSRRRDRSSAIRASGRASAATASSSCSPCQLTRHRPRGNLRGER